jgi:hypothetical protein
MVEELTFWDDPAEGDSSSSDGADEPAPFRVSAG